ncbi:oligosaccharyltransferase subunit ribophorin II domain-containing protein [Phthorimaea operculella]|nr:oligosaccharyltransferase subunit ribophorin II domain-containing protein [Phthorimaea operculella]
MERRLLTKHLPGGSGAYSISIYLGDSAVSNPIAWHLGDIHFNFGKDGAALGSLTKHLPGGSGAYSISIYLGDSAVSNPIAWHLGDIHFNFGKDGSALGEAVKISNKPYRGPLPEIKHMFREPEPRPSRIVSDVFACACAAPLLLLLILWAKLRVNMSYFPFSLSAIIFHLSLGASLGLYGLLWLQLSMFDTVRYLLPLGHKTHKSAMHFLLLLPTSELKI